MSILSVSVSTGGMIALMRPRPSRYLVRKTESLHLNFSVIFGVFRGKGNPPFKDVYSAQDFMPDDVSVLETHPNGRFCLMKLLITFLPPLMLPRWSISLFCFSHGKGIKRLHRLYLLRSSSCTNHNSFAFLFCAWTKKLILKFVLKVSICESPHPRWSFIFSFAFQILILKCFPRCLKSRA